MTTFCHIIEYIIPKMLNRFVISYRLIHSQISIQKVFPIPETAIHFAKRINIFGSQIWIREDFI